MLTADVVQIKTHTQKKQFSDYQWERDERGERGKGKGIKCIVTERDLILDGKHTIQYTCAVLLTCTLEIYTVLLINLPQ